MYHLQTLILAFSAALVALVNQPSYHEAAL